MALVRFPQQYISKTFLAQTGVAVSGPVATAQANGSTLDSRLAGDVLAARIKAVAFTNGLTLNAKWQVLDNDGLTFIDVLESNNPAVVALVTGAGTSGGTSKTAIVTAPFGVLAGGRSARCVVYGGGSGPAQGVGFDTADISYEFRLPANLYK